MTSAITTENAWLRDAVLEEAASLRHLVGNPSYSSKPARLRMNRIAQPRTNKATFELMCLAASAINGCESCIKSHERAVIQGGMTDEHVHDAVRIAATIRAAAVALEM